MKISTIILAAILILFFTGMIYAMFHPVFYYKEAGTLDIILRR
jgi:hypothetical protein